ncbi:PTS beta-glucoside transporter subunit IIBCA [Streptococcus salivarius]|uniref:PTS beta-glucoside transporter subunit IIBCA n=1 Tax=Streptococcus TaxID=1301 RepID=UPI0008A1AB5B|nr:MULTISPECIES: PTS beta-glucoside transporter subunit IIBCA [Streptococcus]MCP9062441.1 glucose PTS transporter subunit IIA [Streptococcus salivarius]MCP9064354.1 glucose PTS transporter subunit IIA [Streptococcus salivarius]MDU7739090.1 glucose PTS transporter subunit IIA [Streptococcus sp.]MTR23829.1 PTS beta-glucoside transporter subunit IIBCA [Streptococcus salivarius]MTR43008.1 PTS beta-glucoside transporter subunit IIBCA [Streptococcus salivarius]
MDNKQIAKEVIDALGGRENVNSVAHCATRLRVMVKDENKINKEKAENIEKVQGAFFNSGQYQMIFGTGTVNKIYDEVVAQGLPTASKDEQKAEAAKQGNWFQRAIRSFGDVFVPLLPAIVATGLFMGIRGAINNDTVLSLFGTTSEAFKATNFYTYTVVLTDTAFAFFPALICWSAFNVFGGSPLLGLVLGLMMVNAALPNAWDVASQATKYAVDPSKDILGKIANMDVLGSLKFTGAVEATKTHPIYFFGFIPVVGYQNSVLPAFFVGLIGAKFEKWVRKWVPDVLDLLLRPLIVFAVMSALALFVIGPVFHAVESYVLAGTEWVLNLPFGLAGLVLGGVHQVIVVTGVHHVFNLLEANLIANTGKDPLNAIITAAMTAQAGATLAVGLKTKDAKLKALAFPATLSAVLGITEPAIFGVNLRFGKPFIMGLIAGAAGGWLASILNLAGTGFGVTIVPGTLLYLNGQVLKYVIMVLVTLALGFALTWIFGYKEEEVEALEEVVAEDIASAGSAPVELQAETIAAPLKGEVVALENVNDPVFSSGAMGKGAAIKPSGNQVVAPFDGEVQIAFPTGHAYGLKSDKGAEVLIHIGIDTVSLDGKGFDAKVQANQRIKKGDVLATFDSSVITEAGLDDTTMVIVTNTADFEDVSSVATGSVAEGADFIAVK